MDGCGLDGCGLTLTEKEQISDTDTPERSTKAPFGHELVFDASRFLPFSKLALQSFTGHASRVQQPSGVPKLEPAIARFTSAAIW
eukprot:6194995-Pleurochrysis_carterae.AAC.1